MPRSPIAFIRKRSLYFLSHLSNFLIGLKQFKIEMEMAKKREKFAYLAI